ncbi:BCNT-domain-containing protein [Mytilinidion resinicola]|uniref:SWR1-complex protein 5 n=1 Tax=Mytilinidion resinicola TaxID=574789 RepID=A0A6A6Z714_9PEZI|nr:BCNT-domain-containing protein [Mytilinidion resinicola]KAF2816035.1 BCNT-domain-containing protein [Mytilinidion resinicola]
MAQKPLSPEADEQYHESSDEDFNPATAPVADESSSSSEDEPIPAATKPASRKRKRKAPSPPEFDSGDEVTIQAAKSRRAKRKTGKADDDDLLLSDDEGGEGGLVKTRAQRRVEKIERRPLARTDGATVDVDALWSQMLAAPLKPTSSVPGAETQDGAHKKGEDAETGPQTEDGPSDEFINLKLVAKHAGQTDTFEKRVRKGSAAHHQYLKDGWTIVEPPPIPPEEPAEPDAEPADQTEAPETDTIHRPLRRPFRFEPNPAGYVRNLPPDRQLTWPRKRTAVDQENAPTPAVAKPMLPPEKVKKLNVVDKTRLDWTGFVDKEGLADDLDEYGKAKANYAERMAFLANVDAKEEEERRRAREGAKGKAKA